MPKEKKRRRDKPHRHHADVMLSMEERTGTGSFKRFMSLLEQLFDTIEDGDLTATVEGGECGR